MPVESALGRAGTGSRSGRSVRRCSRISPPAFQELGGFDETLLRLLGGRRSRAAFPLAGWRCVLAVRRARPAPHGQTLGAASPAARRLEAFGRGYVLAKYRVVRPATRCARQRSQRSTGRCSSSTSSCVGRRAHCARERAGAETALQPCRCEPRSSWRRSVSARRVGRQAASLRLRPAWHAAGALPGRSTYDTRPPPRKWSSPRATAVQVEIAVRPVGLSERTRQTLLLVDPPHVEPVATKHVDQFACRAPALSSIWGLHSGNTASSGPARPSVSDMPSRAATSAPSMSSFDDVDEPTDRSRSARGLS